nr:6-carboxytetrahydropterin synthase [uncultured Porphyromonas sp.]
MITVERYHDISMGHRVVGHESKCRHLHGHNYRIHFVCSASELDPLGRVIDFSEIRDRLCMWLEEHWDHRMMIWSEDPLLPELQRLVPGDLCVVPFNPTAEQIAIYLVSVVGPEQLKGSGITLLECRVEETRKCSAAYRL